MVMNGSVPLLRLPPLRDGRDDSGADLGTLGAAFSGDAGCMSSSSGSDADHVRTLQHVHVCRQTVTIAGVSLFACTINPAVTVVTAYLCVADAANAARAASLSAASEVLLGLLNNSESASESEVSAGMYCCFGPGGIIFFCFGFGFSSASMTVSSGGAKVDADVDGTGSCWPCPAPANGPRNSLNRSTNMVCISPFVTACLKRYVDRHVVTMLHSYGVNLQSKCSVNALTLTPVFPPWVKLCDLCDLWSPHHSCQHGTCKKHNKSSL